MARSISLTQPTPWDLINHRQAIRVEQESCQETAVTPSYDILQKQRQWRGISFTTSCLASPIGRHDLNKRGAAGKSVTSNAGRNKDFLPTKQGCSTLESETLWDRGNCLEVTDSCPCHFVTTLYGIQIRMCSQFTSRYRVRRNVPS